MASLTLVWHVQRRMCLFEAPGVYRAQQEEADRCPIAWKKSCLTHALNPLIEPVIRSKCMLVKEEWIGYL